MVEAYTRTSHNYYSSLLSSSSSYRDKFNPVPVLATGTSGSASQSYTSTLTGEKQPKWRFNVSRGKPATTNLDVDGFTVDYHYLHSRIATGPIPSDALLRRTMTLTGYLPVNTVTDPGVPSAQQTSMTYDRALIKFQQRAKEASSSFQSGQDLVEWRQTYESIRHPLKSLFDLTSGYLKRSKKIARTNRGKSLIKALSNSYLEYTFGWKPLALDVGDALSHAVRQGSYSPVVRIKASAKLDYSGSNIGADIGTPVSAFGLWCNLHKSGVYTTTFLGGMKTGAVNGVISTQQAYQLLPEDFLPTLYNVIPYSFVLDYFTNVGDIVNAISMRRGQFVWCQVTNRTVKQRGISALYLINKNTSEPVTEHGCFNGRTLVTEKIIQRRVVAEPANLFPEFRFELPKLGSKPWVNILALLGGRTR